MPYNAAGIDPRLIDILETAKKDFPQRVEFISGKRNSRTSQHGSGRAIDVQIYDANDKPIPNYQNGKAFQVYEQFAQSVRRVQQEKHPDLSEGLRWGGYFSGKHNYGAVDLMHFDLGGLSGMKMAGGSWDKGLTDAQRALYPDAISAGAGAPRPAPRATPVVTADTAPAASATSPAADTGTPIFPQDKPSPYAGIEPPDALTTNEQAAHDAAHAPYSFGQAIVPAVQQPWTSDIWAIRDAGHRAVDPSYQLDLKQFDEDAKGMPDHYHDYLLDSNSEADYVARKKWVGEDMTHSEKLSAMGFTGTGISLLTGLLSPESLVAAVATAGLGVPFVVAARMSKAARVLMEAATVGTGNAIGTLAVKEDPTVGDVFASFGLGAALGGTIGALRRNPHTRAEADQLAAVGHSLATPEALSGTTALTPNGGVGSTGAAAVGERPFLLTDTPFLADGDSPTARFGAVRFDIGGQLGTSKSELAKLLAPNFGEEAVGHVGGGVVADPATVIQRNIHSRAVRNWQTVVYPAFRDWATEQGRYGRGTREEAWNEFNDEIARLVEEPTAIAGTSPHLNRAVGEFRRVMADYSELLNNPRRDRGGNGRPLSEVGPDAQYVPKYADHEAINTRLERFEWETLRKFVKQAVFSRKPDLPPELADRIANGWLTNISKAGYGMEDSASNAFTLGDKAAFKEAFANAMDGNRAHGFSEEDIAKLFDDVDALGPKKDPSGFSRTKRRTLMDYRFSAEVTARDGSRQRLSMQDFFMKDADFILNRYSRQTSGRVALAQMEIRNPKTGELMIDGITNRSEMDKVLNWVRDDWQKKAGLSQAAKEAGINRDVENLQFLYDAVTGTPHYNTRNAAFSWMRRARDFNFVRLMNRMGIAQAQEFSRMFGTLGVKAVLQHMPALKRIVDTGGRSVPKGDKFLQDMEAWTGRGLEMDFGRHRFRYDENLVGTKDFGKVGRGIDKALEKGKRVTAGISLQTHVHSIQQKITIKAVGQRLYDMGKSIADNGTYDLEKLPGKELTKLRGIGMDDDSLKAVFDAMIKHGEFEDGSKIATLNLANWDPLTRARFVNSMTRWTDRIIHSNDQATLARWMSHPVAQMMTQFRTFVLGSWAKSTLYNIHTFDARTFATMVAELVAGTATYASIHGASSVGQADPYSYLFDPEKGKLTLKNLALAGFSRAAFTSMIPPLADTGLSFTPVGSVFDYRSSGMATSFLLGSPTVDLMNSISTFTSGLGSAAVDGRAVSQRELRAGASAMPFSNWLPITAVLSKMISGLPKVEPRH